MLFDDNMAGLGKQGLQNVNNEQTEKVMELLDQTKFEIRVMTIDDYEKVYSLWMSCKNMGFNNLDDSREGIAKYLRRNPATCFVAECGDSIVGVILSGHDGRRGFIHHLYHTPFY